MEYDVVVVGAGSAGCVVAARLAEDPDRTVLLLEAGPDYLSTGTWPADVLDGLAIVGGDDWGYSGVPAAADSTLPLRRGRLVGGSSAVNYCLALRGRPADHAAWSALGLPRWSWEEILPFYRALENDPAGDDRWHGRSGPTPVHRYARADLSTSQAAFLDAAAAAGLGTVEDHNAPDSLGAGITPRNQRNGRRANAAQAYLAPLLGRPNLTVRGGAEVRSVVVEDGTAVGVRLVSDEVFRAREVVLSAGTYASPKILLLSGIGPAEHLKEVGVDVLADLSGVGANLVEHTSFPVVFAAAPEPPRAQVASVCTTLTLRSTPDLEDLDLHIQGRAVLPTQSRGEHPTGHDFAMVVCLVQPRSRGSVRLRSADVADPPLIDLGIYRHEEDVRRVAHGVRAARRVAEQPPLRDLLVRERRPGPGVAGAELEAAIRAMPLNYHHPVGTCRMGPPEDTDAVVDEHCRVRGIANLAVIDASVMPVSPRATTHLPTLALAERAVALNWPR